MDVCEFPNLEFRPAGPGDADRIKRFFKRLSRETVYERFFTLLPSLPPDVVTILAAPESADHHSIGAFEGDEMVALASWDRYKHNGEKAELGIVVEDDWQHRGLGEVTVRMIIGDAARRGVSTLTATVLSENYAVRRLATTIVRPETTELDGPTITYSYRVRPPVSAVTLS